MLRNEKGQYVFMALNHVGQVGAGRVVPFARAALRQEFVAVPSEIVHLEPIKYEVCGDSFIDEGIESGALMVARKIFERNEVTPGRLCLVSVAGAEATMKRVYLLPSGKVCLRSGNAHYKDKVYGAEFVEIIALVEMEVRRRT